MSNPPDSQATKADRRVPTAAEIKKFQNGAVIRPRPLGYIKSLHILEGFEPFERLPTFLYRKFAPDNRWPPVLYFGFHVPASRIVEHWEKQVLPRVDRSKYKEEFFKTSEESPIPDKSFVAVIFDLENALSRAIGWGVTVMKVHGLPGDRYSRVATLRDNYSSRCIPHAAAQKLKEILGVDGPPMWYLTTDEHAQWDSFDGFNYKSRSTAARRKAKEA